VQVSKGLKQLLSVRRLEEQRCEAELNAANSEVCQQRRQLADLLERLRKARVSVSTSIVSGVVEDRLTAQEEIAVCDRLAPALKKKMDMAEELLLRARRTLLSKRIELRQAEALLEAAQAECKQVEDRKMQHAFDEWFRLRSSVKGRRSDSETH
jgi:flagellar export protein FliJ